jgi:hypothetical protein
VAEDAPIETALGVQPEEAVDVEVAKITTEKCHTPKFQCFECD